MTPRERLLVTVEILLGLGLLALGLSKYVDPQDLAIGGGALVVIAASAQLWHHRERK